MSEKVEQVLQKIHFIERDIELHKNILVAISQDQQEEIEKTIREIVRMNERVAELKRSIAELDPVVHAHILKLEDGTRKFQELGMTKNFQQFVTLNQSNECRLDLVDGTRVECLVKALDDRGGWTGLTHDGEVVEYSAEEVMDF